MNQLVKKFNFIFSFSRDLWMGMRLASKLPFFLKHPVTLDEAKAVVRNRLKRREESFLAIVRKGIYQRPESLYLKLLNFAGCEYGDLERIVNTDGVEGALQCLFRQGVYFTVEEFKGRRPVVRGSFRMDVNPGLFRSPFSISHFQAQTSGSRGERTLVSADLSSVRERAIQYCLAFDALGGSEWQKCIWMGPGGADYFDLLSLCCLGSPPARWFLRGGDPTDRKNLSWRLKTRLMRLGSLLGGIRIPKPNLVPHDDPLPIARWMSDALRFGNVPMLWGFTSSAVRVCQTAYKEGIDLRGAQFIIGGEPITDARREAVHLSGGQVIPLYISIETGPMGQSCLKPEAPDDVHFFNDLNALIQPDSDIQDIHPDALFVTSLQPTAPFLLLNVSMGDIAVITKRVCGCPMHAFGWDTHLHTIRSYEKLTTGGLTMLDTDVIRVLEEVLPARFGGSATDYQLVENEIEGQPCLTLLVDPSIGEVDTDEAVEAFLNGIGASNIRLWRTPGFFRVEHRSPIPTASGKILHLHVERNTKS